MMISSSSPDVRFGGSAFTGEDTSGSDGVAVQHVHVLVGGIERLQRKHRPTTSSLELISVRLVGVFQPEGCRFVAGS